MRQLLAMQRQIQDLTQQLQNMNRVGKVTDVKFDKEKKRWYAKMEQGEGEDAFKTDWRPWKSFSHGTIKTSIPPKKGQVVNLNSPSGVSEMAHIEPYHYDPKNTSPHDKEDEVFIRIHAEEKDEDDKGKDGAEKKEPTQEEKDKKAETDFKMKFTKDGLEFSIGKTKLTMGAKGFKAEHDKHKWEMTPEGIKSSVEDGKSTIDMTKDKVESKSDTVKAQSTDGSGSVTVNDAGVDTQGKKINDG